LESAHECLGFFLALDGKGTAQSPKGAVLHQSAKAPECEQKPTQQVSKPNKHKKNVILVFEIRIFLA
jgi:hypothetical protein